jgi:acyl-CoA thioesterase FadM
VAGLIAGRATFHTRVESWECDFNGHWNTRYYGRAFQAAAEVAAALDGRPDAARVAPPR